MRAPAPRPHPSQSSDLALGAVAVGAVLVGVLWLAGAASAWVSGHRIPHGDLLAGAAAFAHGGDPSRAWHAPVGPAVLYWTLTGVVLTFVIAAADGGVAHD